MGEKFNPITKRTGTLESEILSLMSSVSRQLHHSEASLIEKIKRL